VRNPHNGRARRRPVAVGLALAGALLAGVVSDAERFGDAAKARGEVARVRPSSRPAIEAAFPRESYRPGAPARLHIYSHARGVTLQVFQAGTETGRIGRRDELRGSPVGPERPLGTVRAGRIVWVTVRRDWESGFYFARLTGADGKVGYAPFVVRPRRLGEHRVAVVLPTLTWQAYNFRDDDHDGDEDTWYADPVREPAVGLGRPYENRGVPPHYNNYDQPFLRWLFQTGRAVDYLAQADLEATNGRTLARAYDAVFFPGHHEYVTEREYDVVERYRDLGGSLAFLSANNFYWRVDRRGGRIERIRHWRELGRPEAALVGVQYVDYGEGRGPWIVHSRRAAEWLFSGLPFRRGDRFSSGGIEVDMLAPSSPRGTKLIAEIPNVFGPGVSAHMTYYETARGARVFAAGAFTLAGSVWQPEVNLMMENLWARLAREG
jgi:hypothetical protein